jgi:multicomponent Na+:H+ antiporter subunit E
MRILRELTLFVLLLAFWLLLSGQVSALFVGMGVISAALITLGATRLLERTIGPAAEHPRVHLVQMLGYFGWLFGRMVASALQVAWIVLNPRLSPRPGIVRFRSELASPAARTVLANSITLVPGTMTLEVEDGVFTVHAFTPESADDLASARMQNRIAAVFRDAPQRPPEMAWESGGDPTAEVGR